MPTPLELRIAEQNRARAYKDFKNMGLLGLGVGAGIRGLQGLVGMLRRSSRNRPSVGLIGPTTVPLPLRREEEEEKRADWSWNDLVPKGVLPSTEGVSGALRGTTDNYQNWAGWLPGVGLMGAAGLAGGYAGAGMLMDSRVKKQREEEKERARREYLEAISGRHKISADLDKLSELLQEKRANTGGTTLGMSADTLGPLIGAYGLAATAASLPIGYLAYQLGKKKNPDKLLEEARKRRERELWKKGPQPIFVQPQE